MTVHDEIVAAEVRMNIVLTKRQRMVVATCLKGHEQPSTAYVKRVCDSVLAARP